MNNSVLFGFALVAYFVSTVSYFYFAVTESQRGRRLGNVFALVGVLAHTVGLVIRIAMSGASVFTNTYGTVSLWAWLIVVVYLILERVYGVGKLGAAVLPVGLGLMAITSSPIVSEDISPLIPALRSNWLVLHVTFSILGYAFFAVAAGASILYLLTAVFELTGFSPEQLDQISYKAVAFGFPIFTLGGLVFGAIWAQTAWGRYWGWDPKEVWTLITWAVFALYLHTRLTYGWKGKKSAIIAVLGFFSALFTYFGVNYLLSGLHSYAG